MPVELWQNEPNEAAHPARKKVAELIASEAENVLEVACGIGVDYPLYQKLGIKYYGVDITSKFIEEAKHRGVPCEVADALSLPFADQSFDAVYCKDLFLHLPPDDWKRVLREMVRVARKFVVVVDDLWYAFTSYMPREKYLYHNEKGETQQLCFFNNVYGEAEVKAYAEHLGLNVQVFDGGTVKRVRLASNQHSVLNVDAPSQITVYRKKKK